MDPAHMFFPVAGRKPMATGRNAMKSDPTTGLAIAGMVAVSFLSPWLALALGLGSAALPWIQFPKGIRRWQKPLLQGAVILLGLGTDPAVLFATAFDGLGLSLATLVFCFALGLALARWLHIPRRVAVLVCAGTGICGGSAIAAAGMAIKADEDEMGTSLGVVFLLNAVGLYLFPFLAHRLDMAPGVFGVWSGLALHDLSSVVAAAARFGDDTLALSLSTKLARTLWIVPVAFLLGLALAPRGDRGGLCASVPWFLVGFFGLALLRHFVPPLAGIAPLATGVARRGMAVALFLVGTGLSIDTIRKLGWKVLALAVLLWGAVASATLWWIAG